MCRRKRTLISTERLPSLLTKTRFSMSSFVIAGLAWEWALTPLPYDFSEDKEKRAERFEESERGWMMLFLVFKPKLTERRERKENINATRISNFLLLLLLKLRFVFRVKQLTIFLAFMPFTVLACSGLSPMRWGSRSLSSRRSGPVSRSPGAKTRGPAAQTGQFFLRAFPDKVYQHCAEGFPADTHQHTWTSHEALHAVNLETNSQCQFLLQRVSSAYKTHSKSFKNKPLLTLRPSAV